MHKSSLILLLAAAIAAFASISAAQSVEVTKKKTMTTDIEKSDKKGSCCSGMADGVSHDNSKVKKEIKIIKEKSDDTGTIVTNVTIKTVTDGMEEVKTLEGVAAEEYLKKMEEEDDTLGESRENETEKIVKKKTVKEVKKEEQADPKN